MTLFREGLENVLNGRLPCLSESSSVADDSYPMDGRGLGSVLSPVDSSSLAISQADMVEEAVELFLPGVSSKTCQAAG